jgi:cell division protein FtsL
MEYAKLIKYLWKRRAQIEFFEKNLLKTFFFFFLLFLFYNLSIYCIKIEKKKKKLIDRVFIIILLFQLLSIFITQTIIIGFNQRKFFQLHNEIKTRNRKIRELKKKLNEWYVWLQNHED